MKAIVKPSYQFRAYLCDGNCSRVKLVYCPRTTSLNQGIAAFKRSRLYNPALHYEYTWDEGNEMPWTK